MLFFCIIYLRVTDQLSVFLTKSILKLRTPIQTVCVLWAVAVLIFPLNCEGLEIETQHRTGPGKILRRFNENKTNKKKSRRPLRQTKPLRRPPSTCHAPSTTTRDLIPVPIPAHSSPRSGGVTGTQRSRNQICLN